jgi:hypothetical protein
MNKKKLLDIGFLALEACMHLYLVVYLISIGANIPVIAFTAFELTMFIRLLVNNRKESSHVPCTWREFCPLVQEDKPKHGH